MFEQHHSMQLQRVVEVVTETPHQAEVPHLAEEEENANGPLHLAAGGQHFLTLNTATKTGRDSAGFATQPNTHVMSVKSTKPRAGLMAESTSQENTKIGRAAKPQNLVSLLCKSKTSCSQRTKMSARHAQ